MTDNKIMEMLHRVLAELLLARVSDPDAKAGDLNVARQFLKDNALRPFQFMGRLWVT